MTFPFRSGFPGSTSGKEPACQCRRHKRHRFDSCVRKIPQKEEMAIHSRILAWRIPRTEEPAGYSPWGHKESGTTKET